MASKLSLRFLVEGNGALQTAEAWDVGVAAAIGVEAEEASAGESETDGEREPKLSFFCRNSLLLLAFLLWVDGLDLFFARVDFTLLSLVSREKEKVELMVREKLKSLPWLASAWQKARH